MKSTHAIALVVILGEHRNVEMATNDNGGLQLTFRSTNTASIRKITIPAPSPNP